MFLSNFDYLQALIKTKNYSYTVALFVSKWDLFSITFCSTCSLSYSITINATKCDKLCTL